MEMLKALKCVDDVVAYDKLDYVTNCKVLDIDIFVIGEDWGDKPHNTNVEKYLKSKGKKLCKLTTTHKLQLQK